MSTEGLKGYDRHNKKKKDVTPPARSVEHLSRKDQSKDFGTLQKKFKPSNGGNTFSCSCPESSSTIQFFSRMGLSFDLIPFQRAMIDTYP